MQLHRIDSIDKDFTLARRRLRAQSCDCGNLVGVAYVPGLAPDLHPGRRARSAVLRVARASWSCKATLRDIQLEVEARRRLPSSWFAYLQQAIGRLLLQAPKDG